MAADPITGAEDLINTVVSRIWPDKTQEEKDKLTEALTLFQGAQQIQIEQIKANAASETQPGMHVRDGAGWSCVIGLGCTVLKPLIEWATAITGNPIVLPPVDTSTTSTMLYGLLGLGSLHAAPGIISSVTSSPAVSSVSQKQ